ncbi:MAG: GNAT family N-acetyltransferase, partial [Chloroflexota bacterium]|nr:GNAT family N-acetyltransferase [Chloroflexota bacterium]
SMADIGEGDMTISRMRGWWLESERNLATDNWFISAPDGQLAAYADYSEYDPYEENGFDYAVYPDHAGIGLEQVIYETAEQRARQSVPKASPNARVTLQTRVWASNHADQTLLIECGYEQARVWNRMLIEMHGLPPQPVWPSGISVRTLRPDEVDAVHNAWEDAQRDEYGFASLTRAEFQTWFVDEEEDFDPTLWFLATNDEDGEIVGYTLCRWQRPGEPETGHIRYVAVRRSYRRRGIARALLLHTFREFHHRGKRKVGLAVDSTSLTGADRLYERAGMRATHQMLVFEKVLRERTSEHG